MSDSSVQLQFMAFPCNDLASEIHLSEVESYDWQITIAMKDIIERNFLKQVFR